MTSATAGKIDSNTLDKLDSRMQMQVGNEKSTFTGPTFIWAATARGHQHSRCTSHLINHIEKTPHKYAQWFYLNWFLMQSNQEPRLSPTIKVLSILSIKCKYMQLVKTITYTFKWILQYNDLFVQMVYKIHFLAFSKSILCPKKQCIFWWTEYKYWHSEI